MPDRPDEPDSLDRDLTQDHSIDAESSQADSLDHGQTFGGSGSSSSDISRFDEGWEKSDDVTGFETRYQIDEPIGHGGMGDVFRATDMRLKRPVAIKRLKGDLSQNRRAVERFSTEAEAVARLNHYNIVQIYDVGHDNQGHYIVMELVEGESLATRLKKSAPMELDAAIELISQLCDALSYAHQQGIVHRDIKPANILLADADVPKLTDFGLARLENQDHGQTRAGAVLGTIDFMPPEQHRDAHSADAKSDQWALAATFYQMVTGESPRVIRSQRIPEQVREIVLQALEENPEKRFQDCHALRDALLDTRSAPEQPVRKLIAGECTQCRHVNPVEKTFCEACGETLTLPCPSCQAKAGVWVTYCGECGADIAHELESKREESARQQKDIDALRRGYRHAEAIEQLESMSHLNHPAFEAQKDWAENHLPGYRSELSELERKRDEIVQAATERLKEQDIEGTLQLLDRIPKPLSESKDRRTTQTSGEPSERDSINRR